jgi:Cu+-exporting ATPase
MEKTQTQQTLQIEGMTCANCAMGVQQVLRKKGLSDAEVSFAAGELVYTPVSGYSPDEIRMDISKLGYRVPELNEVKKKGFNSLERRFLFCLLFTLPLFAHMFISWHPLHDARVQFALSIPVMIAGWWYFAKSGWQSLKNGVPNMDVLIALGSASAFIYSIWGSIIYWGSSRAHDFLFFETSATIITLVLLGNLIEQRSVKQTGSALEALARLQAVKALRVDESNDTISEIEAAQIKPGDLLEVHEGGRVAADGLVLTGFALVDEALMTGESLPVEKLKGSRVSGGTICKQGNFRYRALKTGSDTDLARIIDLVKKARSGKPEIQRIGDRVSAVFVPVVVAIALITFLVNDFVLDLSAGESLMRAIAVLVISCPCAMGLATPTAVMSGVGRAARKGILFRDGKIMETLSSIKILVFDKTGTLTTGEFMPGELKTLQGVDESEINSILKALSSLSSHPVSKSLRKQIQEAAAGLSQIEELKGLGMQGKDAAGNLWMMGSARLFKNNIPSGIQNADLFVGKNGECLAGLKISDEIRPGAAETIAELKKMGYRTVLLSGDKNEKCEALAQVLGMNEWFGEKTPQDKLEHIERLKKAGAVAMVGDGINDAPALNLAQAGISISGASEVAQNSAQIILLENAGLKALPDMLKLSRLSLRTIRQNLFWAFFYNVIAIPIAAAGLLNPMVAALSMAFSDVIVIGNSIRLQFRKLK